MARKDFAERSIRGALSFFKEAIFADETAGLPGVLQSLDPRIKIAAVVLCILLVLFTRSLAILGFLYLLSLLLAVVSRIGFGFFLKRTWIFIPLFSLLIAIPAMFSFVTPGDPVLSAGAFHVTRHGLMAAGFFIGRVITSVSLVVLLSMTTRHFDLLKALRFFGIPQMFVMVLGICYRYLYLFVEIVENTHRAIRSRVGRGMHYRKGQRVVAWNIAHLWMRSYALNEQVYNAMVSRGFRGEPVALDRFQTRPRDWLWLLAAVAGVLLLGYAEHWIGI
jgi:cobalt/nickel transport system permease protein